MSDASLGARFDALWRRMTGSGENGVLDELLAAYRHPSRHYHGVEHLRDCLEQLDAAPAAAGDRDLAETALWFHDVVYEPGALDNEARSAALAERALAEAGAPAGTAREVGRLIRLTDHARPAEGAAGALVADVDLSVLGRPATEFAEYERRIRAEYQRMAEPLYLSGRAAILRRLLAREPLYLTDHFRGRYEAAARRNLQRSIQHLEAGGAG